MEYSSPPLLVAFISGGKYFRNSTWRVGYSMLREWTHMHMLYEGLIQKPHSADDETALALAQTLATGSSSNTPSHGGYYVENSQLKPTWLDSSPQSNLTIAMSRTGGNRGQPLHFLPVHAFSLAVFPTNSCKTHNYEGLLVNGSGILIHHIISA